jgi:hypothetical protein
MGTGTAKSAPPPRGKKRSDWSTAIGLEPPRAGIFTTYHLTHSRTPVGTINLVGRSNEDQVGGRLQGLRVAGIVSTIGVKPSSIGQLGTWFA